MTHSEQNLPIDHAVRRAAETEVERSFTVRAGAGSGKTTVLVTRVVNLLASGVHPSRIAAITFTEKAAGELQRRVRDQLEERRAKTPSPSLDAALEDFHALTLSTVHSFCRTLLGNEPIGSRWAPGTRVGEGEIPGIAAALRAWRSELGRRDSRVAKLLGGVSDYAAEKPLRRLLDNRELMPAHPEPIDWPTLVTELAAHHQTVEACAARCTNPKCKRLANNDAFRQLLSACVSRGADGVVDMVVRDGDPKTSKSGGKKGDWPDDSLNEFSAALAEVVEWVAGCRANVHAVATTTMKDVAVPLVLETARRDAVASFDDLLFRAATLLRDDETRARLAGQFDALLIDEVQDTDPMQAEVATLLSRAPSATGEWTLHGPRAGGLFAVGDPKQSIYRFRKADVTVWDDLQAVVERTSPDGALELAQNFRSVPALVAWFNHSFAELPQYAAQTAWRPPATLDPVVVIESDEDEREVGLAADALHVTAFLHQQVASGAHVVDRETGESRPVRWSDVMVLVPGWGRAHELADAFLRSGVEAVVAGGYTFFKSDEVRLCLSALRAIDEPAESECVVHALRGLFGFTLDELAAHVSRGGSWRYTIEDQPTDLRNDEGGVARALELFRALRRDSGETGSWVPRLDRLLEQCCAPHVWSLMADGPARLANLDKLRHMIRTLERETRSPSDVLERLRELSKKGDEAELARADEADDAVRITSVFKAKGLEAPVVVLFDMKRSRPSPDVVTDRRGGRVHFKFDSFEPASWSELREAEVEAFLEERARWMYVAATRARDQLVILRAPKSNLLENLVRGLPAPAGDDDDAPQEGVSRLGEGVEVRVVRGSALPKPELQSETFAGHDARIDALLENPAGRGDPAAEKRALTHRELGRAAKRACARWKSVGEVATGRRGFGGPTESGEDGARGVGRAGGVLVHRTLELLDLNQTRAELRERAPVLLRELASEPVVGSTAESQEFIDACARVLDRILEHDVFDRIRKAPEHWKETPFAMEDRGRVVSGVIDLCFPVDDAKTRWVVVDWKSDSPAEGSRARQAYERQLKLYARALLQTVAPCEEVETILVGPHPEIAEDPADEALSLVHPDLAPALRGLMDAGATVPAVGQEVLDGRVQLELAWAALKVALAMDMSSADADSLRSDGWTLVCVDSRAPGWTREAVEGVRDAMGLTTADDDSDSANDDGVSDENGDA